MAEPPPPVAHEFLWINATQLVRRACVSPRPPRRRPSCLGVAVVVVALRPPSRRARARATTPYETLGRRGRRRREAALGRARDLALVVLAEGYAIYASRDIAAVVVGSRSRAASFHAWPRRCGGGAVSSRDARAAGVRRTSSQGQGRRAVVSLFSLSRALLPVHRVGAPRGGVREARRYACVRVRASFSTCRDGRRPDAAAREHRAVTTRGPPRARARARPPAVTTRHARRGCVARPTATRAADDHERKHETARTKQHEDPQQSP